MADVVKTIGTTSRDYTTITAWEADLDDGVIYSSGDNAYGECYDDSAFDEQVLINGGGSIGLAARFLRGAAGERHDGTAGTGARIVKTSADDYIVAGDIAPTYVEWLEIDGGGNAIATITGGSKSLIERQLIVHDTSIGTNNALGINLASQSTTNQTFVGNRNIVYDIECTNATYVSYGMVNNSSVASTSHVHCNNTVHNITHTAAGSGYGMGFRDTAGEIERNNISTDSTTADYVFSSYSNATVEYNLSSDATASGTGSLTNKTAANQFVSTTGGSEDLHLKSGADAIAAGTDTGTTDVAEIDIDGYDVDAGGDLWDMGADQFGVSADVSPDSTDLALSTAAASLVYEADIAPGSDALTLTTEAPVSTRQERLEPATVDLSLSTQAADVAYGAKALPDSADLTLSTEATELTAEYLIQPPTVELVLDSGAPIVSVAGVGEIIPVNGDLVLITTTPPTLTKERIAVPTGQLTLSLEAPALSIEVKAPQPRRSPGGFYGGRVVTIPPEKKKKRPLPEGPGIAAMRVGDKIAVSRAPNVLSFSRPVTRAEQIQAVKQIQGQLGELRQQMVANLQRLDESQEMFVAERRQEKEKRIREALETLMTQRQIDDQLMAMLMIILIE